MTCHCGEEMIKERAGRTNYGETYHCPVCDHFAEGPCDCDQCFQKRYQPFEGENE